MSFVVGILNRPLRLFRILQTCFTHDCNDTHTYDYVVYSSVKRGYNGTPEMNIVGTWSESESLRMRDELFPNSKSNFRNRLFTVTSLEVRYHIKIELFHAIIVLQ